MFVDILKGIIIGICASAPIGPIAILVTQKTLSKGHRAGFITGMGACVVDTVYAIVAIFALAIAQNFMERHQMEILLVGGVLVALIGFFMMRSNPFRKLKQEEESSYSFKDFFQAMVLGFSNPGAILVTFALFAFFGMGKGVGSENWRMIPIIIAVSIGAAIYWYSITAAVDYFRKRIKLSTILWINRLTGIAVMIIGVVLLVQGLCMLVAMH